MVVCSVWRLSGGAISPVLVVASHRCEMPTRGISPVRSRKLLAWAASLLAARDRFSPGRVGSCAGCDPDRHCPVGKVAWFSKQSTSWITAPKRSAGDDDDDDDDDAATIRSASARPHAACRRCSRAPARPKRRCASTTRHAASRSSSPPSSPPPASTARARSRSPATYGMSRAREGRSHVTTTTSHDDEEEEDGGA